MANNRLYIGCRRCRKWLYLSKHFGGAFYISEEKREELNNFLEEHAYCGRAWSMTFEIFDEMGDDTVFDYYMKPTDTDCGWGEPIPVSHSKEMED